MNQNRDDRDKYPFPPQNGEEKSSLLHEETRQNKSFEKKFKTSVQESDGFYHNTGDGDDDIGYRETTEIMDISIDTLYQYVTQGLLTPKKRPGHRPCFDRRYILEEAARRHTWRAKRGWHR